MRHRVRRTISVLLGLAVVSLRWIDRVIEAASARSDYNTSRERELTLQYLRAGRAVYEGKANAN